jgi:uncharacterized membrane protein YidH (DUF202 family)
MANFKTCFLTFLHVALHASVLMAPLWISGVLHGSDSMLTHVPYSFSEVDASRNITEFGFALDKFSINGTEDIGFSDEQEDAFGNEFMSAKVLYYFIRFMMFMALLLPISFALFRLVRKQMDRRLILSKLARTYAVISGPVMVVCTVLMAIPFVLLMRSNLCGPNFLELRYSAEIESEDESGCEDFFHHHGCHDMEGTVAIIHEDVSASCEFGASGVGFICLTAIFPFFLCAQAYFMNRTAKKLEAEFANDNQVVDEVPVVKMVDDSGDDDKTQGSSKVAADDDWAI